MIVHQAKAIFLLIIYALKDTILFLIQIPISDSNLLDSNFNFFAIDSLTNIQFDYTHAESDPISQFIRTSLVHQLTVNLF